VTSVGDTGPRHPSSSIPLLYCDQEGRIGGIGDYCERLASALRAAGVDARTLTWRARGIDAGEGHLILQYNPFAFGRWGFAPRLPFDMLLLRRRRPDIRQAARGDEAHDSGEKTATARTRRPE
jgi:hypothetical protein